MKFHLKSELFTVFISLITILLINLMLISTYLSHKKMKDKDYYEVAAFENSTDLKALFDVQPTTPVDLKTDTNSLKIKIPIILYHYVEYVKDKGDTMRQKLDIVPAEFERQLKTLADAGYISYFVRDIPDFLSGKRKPSSKSIILTFDDGYEDFYTDALPILMKYQMKSTLYVVPHFFDKPNYLSEKQFIEITKNPLVEIGSHTLDHTALKGVSEKLLVHEIVDSKKLLEDKYHLKIETFAYPYGSYTARAVDSVRQAGYTAAVSVLFGSMHSEDSRFLLTRIRPGFFIGNNILRFLEGVNK